MRYTISEIIEKGTLVKTTKYTSNCLADQPATIDWTITVNTVPLYHRGYIPNSQLFRPWDKYISEIVEKGNLIKTTDYTLNYFTDQHFTIVPHYNSEYSTIRS